MPEEKRPKLLGSPMALSACGMGAVLLWLSLASFQEFESYLACNVGCVQGFAGLLVAGRLHSAMNAKLRSIPGAAILTVAMAAPAATMLGAMPAAAQGALWALGGVASAATLGLWFEVVCQQRLPRAVAVLVAAYFLSAIVHLALSALAFDSAVGRSAMLVLAGVVAGLLVLCVSQVREDDTLPQGSLPAPDAGFIVAVIGFMLCLALFFGISHAFPVSILGNPHPAFVASLCLDAVLSALLAFWMATSVFGHDRSSVFYPVLVVVLIGLLVALFVFRNDLFFLLGVQFSARTLVALCLCLMALALAKRGSCPALLSICLLLGLYRTGLAAGMLLSETEASHLFFGQFPHEGIYLLSACAAVLIMYLLLAAVGFFRETEHGQPMTATVVLETSFIDARCDAVGAEHHLKEREIEIIKLLCHGRSRKYIADSLYLSENTVKWYCRQIYQKLGIHKKQELLSLIGVDGN